MNLIEELGLENAKVLNGMLQKHAVPESWRIAVINGMWQRSSVGFTHGELRTAIADHDQQLCGQSEEKEFNSGDLVALNGELFPDFKLLYVVKQESKRFGFVAVYLSGEEIRNFHTRDVRRATEKELDLGYRVTQTPYSNTEYFNTRKIEADHCTDIRNHISPCTEVIER